MIIIDWIAKFRSKMPSLTLRHRFGGHSVEVMVLTGVLVVGAGWWLVGQMLPAKALSEAAVTGQATVVNTGQGVYFAQYGAEVMIDNYSRQMSGYAWSDDFGWLDFGETAENPDGPVLADRHGILSGNARLLQGGLVQFAEHGASVKIENGVMSGYAWSDDLGWIDFGGVTIPDYNPDLLAPDNPASANGFASEGGAGIVGSSWYNHRQPYFSWSQPSDYADSIEPSGVAGYYVYFGTDASADPSEYSTNRYFQSPELGVDGDYYLRIKTRDVSGNVSASETLFTYRFELTVPAPPTVISVSPSGYSRVNHYVFSWPTSGDNGPSDSGGSGLGHYEYRLNGSASWQRVLGDQTVASLTLEDQATNGVNTFDLRAVDYAGNAGESTRTNFYFNDASPTAPKNLTVTPSSSSTNSFAFSWQAPEGEIKGYYYSINALPTLTNTSYTEQTSLPAGPFATQQGQNTLYIVAVDSAGNVDFDSCSNISGNPLVDGCTKVDFIANTVAPGVPTNIQGHDISDRETGDFSVAVKWTAPVVQGSDFAGYDIFRSTDGASFTKVGSTTSAIYADSGLESKTYYYKVRSKDSAGSQSVDSTTVVITPTGRYTTPPKLVSGPTTTVTPTALEVRWATDRPSSSFVKIEMGNTFVSEQGQSELTTDHVVRVVGLRSQVEYAYSIQSTDIDGNLLTGAKQYFTTESAPSVYDLNIANITQTSAIISFKSTAVANFTLHYGPTAKYGQKIQESSGGSTTNHTMMLHDLMPGQMYYFRVVGLDSDGNELRSENSFVTLPMPSISGFGVQPVPGMPTTTLDVTWQTNVPTSSTVNYMAHGLESLMQSNTDLKLSHNLRLSDLADNSEYKITASGRDQFGNLVSTSAETFSTPEDSREPVISSVVTETSNIGSSTNKAQIIVSWQTDEPANSQVEYGTGLGDDEYNYKTILDGSLTTEHTVIISGLEPGKPYHLRVRSSDKAGNLATSRDRTVITGEVPKSGLQAIINTLARLFGVSE